MKFFPLTLSAFLVMVTALLPAVAVAETNPTSETCMEALDRRAAAEQHEFRATLFGPKKAEEARVSEVRFSEDGDAWIKITDDEWRSTAFGFEDTTWSDSLMDERGQVEPRVGIFETKRRLGSELVPYLTQAARTLQCRLEALCTLLEHSDAEESEEEQVTTVKVDGCVPLEEEVITECQLIHGDGTIPDQENVRSYCRAMIEALRDREFDVLAMTVEYDSAYRSVLQLSGIVQGFLKELRGTILGSLRSATQLIATLGRIPCFLGTCADGTPMPKVIPPPPTTDLPTSPTTPTTP